MKKNIAASGIALMAIGAVCASVLAATQPPASANLILTWSADNFYPSDYEGKALPANGSSVSVSLETVKSGKLQDLKSVPIAWYLDGDWLSGGVGQKHASFVVTKAKGASHSLRAVAGLPEGEAEQTVSVPIVAREIVIETPYRSGFTASAAKPIVFRAVPYFFNITSITDLLFSWTAGGDTRSASGDNELSVNLGGAQNQTTLPVSVAVRGVSSVFESASDAVIITINP
ncbi:MAG: hypothetical protein V1656_01445 [Candidatus Jorgensenbacteria bacterium]